MLKMNGDSIQSSAQQWQSANVKLPQFNRHEVVSATKDKPTWVHFGAGNIFRGYIAALGQDLLNKNLMKTGIIAAETFDFDIVDKIYKPFDDLTMLVTLNADGTTKREIIGAVTHSLRVGAQYAEDVDRLNEIMREKCLQMLSFTITEKGYAIYMPNGELLPVVKEDMQALPSKACHTMSVVCALLLERFAANKAPIAVVSMDNCSNNGDKLKSSVVEIAKAWCKNGFVQKEFVDYLCDEQCVSFPVSMIDKITPRPAQTVCDSLAADGIEDMAPIVTSRNTFIAPFVNAEAAQYLVIEDKFPNGRPPLEKAGVFITDRETVEKTECMKVTTCLNPLHTAMSVYGCVLGHTLICEMMKDDDIVSLIKTLGYKEGLPVVVDPGILSPKEFIDEVVQLRLPNPFVPDSPQRIVTDTSQKVGIRFGETVKSYIAQGKDIKQLVALPLAIAGWLRYLLAVDDDLCEMEVSSDPLKDELQAALSGIKVGDKDSYNKQILSIIKNKSIFGVDLEEAGLSEKIEGYFVDMISGKGAVRKTLNKELNK